MYCFVQAELRWLIRKSFSSIMVLELSEWGSFVIRWFFSNCICPSFQEMPKDAVSKGTANQKLKKSGEDGVTISLAVNQEIVA